MSIISTDGADRNGYRLHTTSPIGSIPCSSRSAIWSGLLISARMPACNRGWSVLTRPPSISGEPVTSSTVVWGRPRRSAAAAVLPLATSS